MSRSELEQLRNLGEVFVAWLREVGVTSRAELAALGPVEAYARIKERHRRAATVNLLWALAAALEDRDPRDLPPERKDRLRAELRAIARPAGAACRFRTTGPHEG